MTSGLTRAQVIKVKEIVERESELKYYCISNNDSITDVMTVVGTPFAVPQGVQGNQHIGNTLTWFGDIHIRFQIVNSLPLPGFNGDAYNSTRVVIIQWFSNSSPGPTDIFHNGPTGSPSILSHYNHARRDEFLVLFDKIFRTVGPGTSGINPVVEDVSTGVLDFKISLDKARKTFQSVVGFGENRLYMCLVSDASTSRLTYTSFSYSSKVLYYDS